MQATAFLDTQLPRARVWATVVTSPDWWCVPAEDRAAHRSGVELAHWTNRQVRRSGLCFSCWLRESEPDAARCDGGACRNAPRPLQAVR
ncbi:MULTISPECIES: hypothetical protein [Streptomyces]|uniref:Zinc-ribbon domain-containing protein n=1 Tax=Streptomyces lonegramiae TaxID=3075524 RepID=A0ABU2X6M1_9ACTN|nr:hypothetical protein [Streptomyces sp. DSM 41529]MDT0541567.1 hypothetical protein [Streptomyces sp. DSM 41529]